MKKALREEAEESRKSDTHATSEQIRLQRALTDEKIHEQTVIYGLQARNLVLQHILNKDMVTHKAQVGIDHHEQTIEDTADILSIIEFEETKKTIS